MMPDRVGAWHNVSPPPNRRRIEYAILWVYTLERVPNALTGYPQTVGQEHPAQDTNTGSVETFPLPDAPNFGVEFVIGNVGKRPRIRYELTIVIGGSARERTSKRLSQAVSEEGLPDGASIHPKKIRY